MKTVLFVPGFHEELSSKDYERVFAIIRDAGYNVRFVPIAWPRTTIQNWTAQLNDVYAKYESNDTILAGFSYGAMTALACAAKRNPTELWLFSLSPYFPEDLHVLKKTWIRGIGKRRLAAFKALDFDKLAAAITCKTLLLVGEIEAQKFPQLGTRAELAHRKLADNTLVRVPGCGHDVTDPNYVAAIQRLI